MGTLPRVRVVTTGGTICMKVDPKAGGAVPALSGEDLVATVPGLDGAARVDVEEFTHLPGTDMGPSIWAPLVRRLKAIFAGDPDLAGIVVTHGTGLLDEAAYFVDLGLGETRPVVFTGAARNASTWDTDGPRNILGAVRVAAAPAARDMGVLVCLNDQIHAARDAVKRHANSVEAYMSGDHGLLGNVYCDTVRFHRKPLRRPHFSVDRLAPRVEIVMMYSGADGRFVQTCIDTRTSGIVIQAVNTGLHNAILKALGPGSSSSSLPISLWVRCIRSTGTRGVARP